MKMMDKERRKKKSTSRDVIGDPLSPPIAPPPPVFDGGRPIDHLNSKKRIIPDNSNSVQTEIRTEEFVVRLLLSIFFKFSQNQKQRKPKNQLYKAHLSKYRIDYNCRDEAFVLTVL